MKDYTGHKFGRLTALTYHREHYSGKPSLTFWTCQCDCGDINKYRATNLVSGRTTNCKICRFKYADKTHHKDREVKLTHQGRTQTIREWAAELGIPASTIQSRRHRKLPIELVLTQRKLTERFTHDGRTQSLPEWAAELGITASAIHARLKFYGWTKKQALTLPATNKDPSLQPNKNHDNP